MIWHWKWCGIIIFQNLSLNKRVFGGKWCEQRISKNII